MPRKLVDTTLNAATFLLLVVAALALVQPGTPVRGAVEGWWRRLREPGRIASVWARLSDGGSRIDSAGRAVELIEFADFQCPFCRQSYRGIQEFLASHPNVGMVYRHLPIPGHLAAEPAAVAAICAGDQNVFRAFHDYLFEHDAWESDRDWTAVAKAAGVGDIPEFEACLQSGAAKARVESDMALAKTLGITGTPTFVTRRRILQGVQQDSSLAASLDLEP